MTSSKTSGNTVIQYRNIKKDLIGLADYLTGLADYWEGRQKFIKHIYSNKSYRVKSNNSG